MRLVAASFLLVGAAALVSFAAPAVSSKKAATKSPAKSAASAKRSTSTKRPVGRRTVRRRGTYNPYIGQQRPTPERVQEIERALADRGFLTTEPDTTWDAASSDAVKRFQQSQNLPSDGKLSALTVIALGLGSRQNGVVMPATAPAAPPVSAPEPTPPPPPPPVTPEPLPVAAKPVPPVPATTPAPPPPPAPAAIPPPAPAPLPRGPVKNPPLVVPDFSIPQ